MSERDELEYWHRMGDAALAESKAIEALLGGAHHPTEGAIRESVVRKFLKRTLPSRYEVSTGFVAWQGALTRQLDVLVWDHLSHTPLYREGDLVIVEPAACLAIAEVKAVLDRSTLLDALDVLYHPAWDNHLNLPVRSPVRAIFAFRSNWQRTAPMLETLAQFYRNRLGPNTHRLCMQVRPPARLSFPGSPVNRLGDFDWPRFPELLDVLCVIASGLAVSQHSVHNANEEFPGYDPMLRVSSHQQASRALGEAAAVIAELLGRGDPNSVAHHRRKRLVGENEYWLLGERPAGKALPDHVRSIKSPLWRRPFQVAHPWDPKWPLKLGRPRFTMRVSCAHATCSLAAATDRDAKASGWKAVELSGSVDDTIWFCPTHSSDPDLRAIVDAIVRVLAAT